MRAGAPDDGNLFSRVHDFFESGVWLVAQRTALLFLVVLWLASAYAVYKDARRRVRNPWLVAPAVAVALCPPFLGPLLYALLRPPEYLDETRLRELGILEMQAGASRHPVCRCGTALDAAFLVCPGCGVRLRSPCAGCARPLERGWTTCPSCETPTGRRPAPPAPATPGPQPPRRSPGTASRAAGAAGRLLASRRPGPRAADSV